MYRTPAFKRLMTVLLAVLMLILCGTTGYALLERWPVGDGFFMTMITLSTVGYGETNQLTPTGRLFTSGLIVVGLITMTCWTAVLTSFVVEGDLSGRYERRRTLKMVAKLKKHVIVCGSDKMARAVLERLVRARRDVVVVDDNQNHLIEIKRQFPSVLTIEGNATSEVALAEANIMRAKFVVAAMESPVDNLLISITCKDLGRNIAVYARSNDMTVANRMRKAGVDEVICPSQICGDQVANLILAGAEGGEPPKQAVTA